MDWNHAADMFGVDLKTASLLGLIVYAVVQNSKKWLGRIGWRVVSMTLLLSAGVSLGVNASKLGGIVLTWATLGPTLFLAVFVAAVALTIGTAAAIAPDNRPPLLGDVVDDGENKVFVPRPIKPSRLAQVVTRVQAKAKQVQAGVDAFKTATKQADSEGGYPNA